MKTPTPLEQKVADFLMYRGCLKMAWALHCARLIIHIVQKGAMKTPEQIDEEVECQKCHALVQLGDGLIPTKYCNLCAQELVESMSDRLQAVERENAELNKALALKLDALPSGLSAGQSIALEKRLQAVKAEREAHIATTNQLQSELAQALADRDRYRQGLETIRNRGYTGASFVAGEFLQPAQKDPE